MASLDELQFSLQRALGEVLLREIASRVASQSIRNELHLAFSGDDVLVRSSYYWTIILDRGRAAVVARPGRFLLFYPNPLDDSRLRGGRPLRLRDAKRLKIDPAQLRAEIKNGTAILTKRVGPVQGSFFFERGAEALRRNIKGIVKQQFDDATREFFASLPEQGGVALIRTRWFSLPFVG